MGWAGVEIEEELYTTQGRVGLKLTIYSKCVKNGYVRQEGIKMS